MDGYSRSHRFELSQIVRNILNARQAKSSSMAGILVLLWVVTPRAFADNQVVFDLDAVVAVERVLTSSDQVIATTSAEANETSTSLDTNTHHRSTPNDTCLWRIPLELSTLIRSANAPSIQQILLEIDLVDPQNTIADYQPRTHTASDFVGNVAVEQCDEKAGRIGLNLRGSYPPLAVGDFASEVNHKKGETRKYLQVAPIEIVAASGTKHRRQGVFFKLRATKTQVLEGDKAFELVIQTPSQWRRGLLRVRARAEGLVRPLPGFPAEQTSLGEQFFLVAMYATGDQESLQYANALATALRSLEKTAIDYEREIRRRANPTVFHQMATKLDLAPPKIQDSWLQRVLLHPVDVANDRQMRLLPVDVRVAILDYQQARSDFTSPSVSPVSSLIGTRQITDIN